MNRAGMEEGARCRLGGNTHTNRGLTGLGLGGGGMTSGLGSEAGMVAVLPELPQAGQYVLSWSCQLDVVVVLVVSEFVKV